MEGGTTFYFVTGEIEAALEQAKAAAASPTVRQYLQAGLIDEIHFAFTPVMLGRGEAMFTGIDLPALGFRVAEVVPTELATHILLTR